MALAGVTLRTTKGSKLTIAELDSNFSAITSSVETSTTNINTINSRVSQSVIAFPNLTTTANGAGGVGLITSGALFVSGALTISGSSVNHNTASFSGIIRASGSANSVLASNFADDSAANAGGIPIGGIYHTNGAIKIRLT
jgi:hypothetical protein